MYTVFMCIKNVSRCTLYARVRMALPEAIPFWTITSFVQLQNVEVCLGLASHVISA